MEVVDDCELCLREESISVRVILIEDHFCIIIACWLLRFLATLIAVDFCEFLKIEHVVIIQVVLSKELFNGFGLILAVVVVEVSEFVHIDKSIFINICLVE